MQENPNNLSSNLVSQLFYFKGILIDYYVSLRIQMNLY
jgi:hypothetical protein